MQNHREPDLAAEVETITAETANDQIIVTPAKLALNIHPAGVNKGRGLQWLAQATGIEFTDMGGVGDSTGDIDFLRLVGYSAAPHNATNDVKSIVSYVSPYNDAAGLQDILDHWFPGHD